jgi:hypothetical protein
VRAAGAIARATSFPSMASRRGDYPREMTNVYSTWKGKNELLLPIQSNIKELLELL